ncbi:hypothetical protein [Candidatus Arcticimaribacter forsetii]|uniref:hypothetical protein n=1 Tax=Candidatus Arcticimaribacter forsetii TaxID=2820661 RepID=UPI002077407C|nr:hypothetical protein [Candidatus Arcticimaribacter forsetii]
MIRQNEHFILIPKGAGKFYRVRKNQIFIKTYWGGQIVYRILKQTSTRTFFNEEVYIELRDFIIAYAELEGVILDEFILNNSLQPMQQDNDQIGVVSDICSLEDIF